MAKLFCSVEAVLCSWLNEHGGQRSHLRYPPSAVHRTWVRVAGLCLWASFLTLPIAFMTLGADSSRWPSRARSIWEDAERRQTSKCCVYVSFLLWGSWLFLPTGMSLKGVLSRSPVEMKHTFESILYATKESWMTKLDTRRNIMR